MHHVVATVVAAAMLIAAATSMGYLIAMGHAVLVAVAGIAVLLFIGAVRAPGPFVALMLLAIMNGLPGVDLSGKLGPLHIQDYGVIALIIALHSRGREAPNPYRARLIRLATLWSACLTAWWITTLARSVLIDGVPILKAALYGRDFLYFAILVPVALRASIPRQSLKTGAVLLGVGIIAYAIGQVTVSLSGTHLPWLVHPGLSSEVGHLSRLYSPMNDVVGISLLFVLARVLSQEAKRDRIVLSGVAALLLLAVALQFTRATYFAMLVALVVAVTVHTMRGGSLTALTSRIAMLVLAGMLIVLLAMGLNVGRDARIVGAVASRVESGVQNIAHTTGTYGYRHQLDEKMLEVLGADWPIGLGFLHPHAHYVGRLPEGSIRNTDTGILNALMTMGVVGVLLLYAPLVFAFMQLVRLNRPVRPLSSRQMWLVYGGTAWVTWVVVGSATLVVLFSITGLVLTALVLAVLGQTRLQGALQPQ
jgi:hypothetical protein